VSTSFRSFTFSRLAGALAGLWLCGAGAAWAGDGGDLGSLQNITNGFCAALNMASCPQLPTVTQAILEVAGLENSPPEMVAAQNKIPPGSNVTAGNAPALLVDKAPTPFPIDSNSSPALFDAGSPPSGLLSTLTPLAFISQKSGTAAATQLYDPKADTFLYAVGVPEAGQTNVKGFTEPDTAFFFYDDLFRVAQNFTKGQIVAKFSFPLTVLNSSGSENAPVMVTLEVIATTCNGGPGCVPACKQGTLGPACLQAYVYGGGIGTPSTPVDASQLGIQFALVFGPSPTSPQKHAIFEVAVPLLVTGAITGVFPTPTSVSCSDSTPPPSNCSPNTDPAYFYFQITRQAGNGSEVAPFPPPSTGNLGLDTVFAFDETNPVLPAGASIGLAPTAAPFCTATTCPASGDAPPPLSVPFALCASLPDNSNGPAARLRPAVGAYYAIATDGETLVGAPVPSVFSACPAL